MPAHGVGCGRAWVRCQYLRRWHHGVLAAWCRAASQLVAALAGGGGHLWPKAFPACKAGAAGTVHSSAPSVWRGTFLRSRKANTRSTVVCVRGVGARVGSAEDWMVAGGRNQGCSQLEGCITSLSECQMCMLSCTSTWHHHSKDTAALSWREGLADHGLLAHMLPCSRVARLTRTWGAMPCGS